MKICFFLLFLIFVCFIVYRTDKANVNHPFRLARAELIQAVASFPTSIECKLERKLLTDWGIPETTASRYMNCELFSRDYYYYLCH